MFKFKLPDLGEGIHEGEILKWYVQEGETIAEDAPLVDVETDKAAVTIPSPKAGKVVRLGGPVGDTIEVGAIIAVIDDGTEEAAQAEAPAPVPDQAPPSPKPEDTVPAAPTAPAVAPAAAEAGLVRVGPVPAAPAVRRRARELGIDLHQVPGSGPAGRVSNEDLERFAAGGASPAATPAGPAISPAGIPFFQLDPLPDFASQGPVEREPVRSIRRKVARKMVTSMVVVPHVALMDDVDVTDLEEFRQQRKAASAADEAGARLSLLPFVVKAVTECLVEFPMFNASLDPQREEIITKHFYNIGFAADTPRGLLVPVVHDADSKSIAEISAEITRLALGARAGTLAPAEMQGGTFTITNVGPIAGTRLIPTINYPEVAIIGMGRAEQKVVVRDGEIAIRTILPLTLTFDHRIADGADAARFIRRLGELLSSPLTWLLER